MGALIDGLSILLSVIRPLVLGAAVVTAAAAVASWATVTRRISPFSALARLTRKRVDPLFLPVEKRVIGFGGQPAHAPWWTLAAVVVGGLLLISAIDFLRTQLITITLASRSGVSGIVQLVVMWTFAILKLAIIARVIASWVGGSPYSKWWRWAYVLTEPLLAPLRRIIPTFGAIDLSPIVAYFGLSLLQSLIMRAL